MSERRDLIHWHGQPSELREPPPCCAGFFGKRLDEERQQWTRDREGAVHAERRRVVLDALDSIEAYWSAIASVLPLDDPGPKLAKAVVDQCVNAIRQAGCICPMVDVTQLGDPYPRQMAGGDPRCGLHGVRQAVAR